MRVLPFFMREANTLIKIYPNRIIFQLPKITNMRHVLKTVEIDGTFYVIADTNLEGKIGCALAEDKDSVVNIGNVESKVTTNRCTSCAASKTCTRE